MHLYFAGDNPRLIFDSWKYARVRKNCEKIEADGYTFYLADAHNYREALEHLILKSKNFNTSSDANFRAALISGTSQFVDVERGDGCMLLMLPFDEWHQHLSIDDIPEDV